MLGTRGPATWVHDLGVLPWRTTWAHCLGALPGRTAWAHYLGALPGKDALGLENLELSKYPFDLVGIALGDLSGRFQALRFEYDQAATRVLLGIDQGSGKADAPGFVQDRDVGEMALTVLLSQFQPAF